MTALDLPPLPAEISELELATRQLAAIERFHAAHRVAAAATATAAQSREMRMDAARRLEVLQRQQAALIERSHAQLVACGSHPLLRACARRAVVAHRQPWFRDKIVAALGEHGVEIVSQAENGADVVGLAVAEQPDLLVVEDGLEMMSTDEVITSLRQYCPEAVVAAQVAHSGRIPPLLEAGATTVFVRQVPPVDVATALWELLS